MNDRDYSFIELSAEEVEQVLCGGHPDYDLVDTQLWYHSRWSVTTRYVVQSRHTEPPIFWAFTVERGATECQMYSELWDKRENCEPFECVEVERIPTFAYREKNK